ncbi:MAG: sulfatase, partial [Candidatus Nealsonbacteria bacterium]|nr:sulfatase [Candidatus Nealsonbacteria bacterium]
MSERADPISRRRFLGQSALTAATVAAGAAAPAAEEQSKERPNLIYVFADQLRYLSCGYAGDRRAHTPNIDRLAAGGVNFKNCTSMTPVCSAYRASLMTGKYTTSTGMVINELRLSPEHECLGHVLGRGGYETGYIGKWHLWANQLGHHHEDRNGFTPPGPYRLGFDGHWAAYNFHHGYYDAFYYRDEPKKIYYTRPGVERPYEPDAQTDMAIDYVGRASQAEQPFALMLSYGTPHDPWGWNNVPERYAEMFRDVRFPKPPNYSAVQDPYADAWATMGKAYVDHLEQYQQGYYAMTANLDWNIGRLMAALREKGQLDNTIVVFTSDHGEMFGAHGRRAKNIFYEEAARVPFLVHWPKRIAAGGTSDACLNTPDIMPTLLGMLDLPVPEAVEGMDLSHCALGIEGPEPEAALMQNTGACAAWQDGHEWRALRDKRFTYAVYRRDSAAGSEERCAVGSEGRCAAGSEERCAAGSEERCAAG